MRWLLGTDHAESPSEAYSNADTALIAVIWTKVVMKLLSVDDRALLQGV